MPEVMSTQEKNAEFKRLIEERAHLEEEEKAKKIAKDNEEKAKVANSKDSRKKLGRDDLKTIDVAALITQKPAQIFDMIGFLRANLEEAKDADPAFVEDLQTKIAEIQEAVKDNGIKYDPSEKKDEKGDEILPNEALGEINIPSANKPQQGFDPKLLDPSKLNSSAIQGDKNSSDNSPVFGSSGGSNNVQGGGSAQPQRAPNPTVSDFSTFNLWASEQAKRYSAIAAGNPGASDSEIRHMGGR